ncbi:MAG: oligopeptide/dipeptide ABC transporter ATP-binding protein, partial [Geminicoccaceae bacterium]
VPGPESLADLEVREVVDDVVGRRHPYTRALLAASPVADPARRGSRSKLSGELPSPLRPPPGCVFHPRCPLQNARCREEVPKLQTLHGRLVACHAVEEGRD